MLLDKIVGILLVLTFLSNSRDVHATRVLCELKKSCVLPCHFKPGDDVVIHWHQMPGDKTIVHSYYYEKDQLALQDQRFRGRTSLAQDQISSGNASLRLTGLQVQDQGTYKCYFSTNSGNNDLLISLQVEAPVQKVHIQREGNRISCSSEGIYPQPGLIWSTSPPTNLVSEDKPTIHQTEEQLYNISSSLTLPEGLHELVITCTISTSSSSRSQRITLYKPVSINSSVSETTISCTPSNTDLTSFTWRFNLSQIILTQSGLNPRVSEGWKQQVKTVSPSGTITLHQLSSDHQGVFSCEGSSEEETFISNISLRIEESPGPSVVMIACIIVGVLVVLAALVGVLVYRKCRSNGVI